MVFLRQKSLKVSKTKRLIRTLQFDFRQKIKWRYKGR